MFYGSPKLKVPGPPQAGLKTTALFQRGRTLYLEKQPLIQLKTTVEISLRLSVPGWPTLGLGRIPVFGSDLDSTCLEFLDSCFSAMFILMLHWIFIVNTARVTKTAEFIPAMTWKLSWRIHFSHTQACEPEIRTLLALCCLPCHSGRRSLGKHKLFVVISGDFEH